MNKVNLGLIAASLLVLVLLSGNGFQEAGEKPLQPDDNQGISLYYIANAGVLIKAGAKQVLIDGLHQPYRPAYRSTPPALKNDIYAGKEPFNSIDLVLVSHIHRDHFDPADVAGLLKAQPEALLFSSQQVIDSIQVQGVAPNSQLQSIVYQDGNYVTTTRKDITVRAGKVAHGSERFRWIQNLGHIVEIDGIRFLHVGDPGFGREDIEQLVANTRIDVALLPGWFLSEPGGRAVIDEIIKPKHLAFLHVSPGDEQHLRQLAEIHYPGARVLSEPLEEITYEK